MPNTMNSSRKKDVVNNVRNKLLEIKRSGNGTIPLTELTASNLYVLLALNALLVSARAECEACFNEECHIRKPILTGFSVTDQLAIDRRNNILYLQLYGDQNTAIFLDDLQHRLVNKMHTKGMAVDQNSSVLYLGTNGVNDKYYKYILARNTTDTISIERNKRKSDIMHCAHDILFFIHKNQKGVNNYKKRTIKCRTYLEDYVISDFVVIDEDHIFFVSNDTVYYYVWDNQKNPNYNITVIDRKKYVLSLDKNDNVYLADPTAKVIYKYDEATDKLEIYGSYTSASIQDFVFDKNNRILFHDAEGSVAQWMPAPTQQRCVVEAPRDVFHIREVYEQDEVVMQFN